MPLYTWNTVQKSLATGLTFTFFMAPNPRRVSILLAMDGGGQILLSSYGGATTQGIWYNNAGGAGRPLLFNEVGPIMQQALYVAQIGGVTRPVSVTEIFMVSECK